MLAGRFGVATTAGRSGINGGLDAFDVVGQVGEVAHHLLALRLLSSLPFGAILIQLVPLINRVPYSSRNFIGALTGAEVGERLEGSLGASAAAVTAGASLLRVHDVGATVRMLRVVDAIVRA